MAKIQVAVKAAPQPKKFAIKANGKKETKSAEK